MSVIEIYSYRTGDGTLLFEFNREDTPENLKYFNNDLWMGTFHPLEAVFMAEEFRKAGCEIRLFASDEEKKEAGFDGIAV